jgi:putative tricarboxylic transport membrane protein
MRSLSDVWGSLFCGCLGIGFIVGSIKLRLGTATEPQPGFFPFLGGIFLFLLSSILFVRALRGCTGETTFGNLRRPAILILGLVFYVSLLDSVGYIIATTCLAAIVLLVMDTQPRWLVAGTSLSLALVTYFLFNQLLGMPLPGGILSGIW